MAKRKIKELKWHKLDNTAKIYPVIANNDLTGVYRISVTLTEAIDEKLLQETVEKILPWFAGFRVRLRRGVFWYYFETNKKKPKITEEYTYPCRYIDPYSNNMFLFSVTYYQNRINLEVFHALTDGYGAINFLKELTCQYLRLSHPESFAECPEGPTPETSFNMEDSYLKYYKKLDAPGYTSVKAYQIRGEKLAPPMMGVIHGYMDIEQIKAVCKKYQVSITQYLASVLVWSIYWEYLRDQTSKQAIRINIPVNLRPIFGSTTTRNFFAIILAEMTLHEEHYEFEDILRLVSEDFATQLTKEHLEKLISYNVSNEENLWIRMIPLFIKNLGVKFIYGRSSKAFTTTLSNCGLITVLPEYEPYIDKFHFIMGVSKRQPLKCVLCSYGKQLVFTFSSVFTDTALQRTFFRKMVQDGIEVTVESNGIYS